MIDGIAIGHHTRGGTGVTVILSPAGTVGSGEIRGGAPAEREFALLDPRRSVERVDAVVYSGGSAFGLASADGVMQFLRERDQGFPTAGGPVPIVPAMCVFDLLETSYRPTAEDGYAAAAAATAEPAQWVGGRVGAGAGATVGKWKGREFAVAGGVGIASGEAGGHGWLALAVVNAVGDVMGVDGLMLAGSSAPATADGFPSLAPFEDTGAGRTSTTLVVVATDQLLDKRQCHALAAGAHDGFARSLRPAHTSGDGDAVVVLSTGHGSARSGEVQLAREVRLDLAVHHAAEVAAAAIRASIGPGVVEWEP